MCIDDEVALKYDALPMNRFLVVEVWSACSMSAVQGAENRDAQIVKELLTIAREKLHMCIVYALLPK